MEPFLGVYFGDRFYSNRAQVSQFPYVCSNLPSRDLLHERSLPSVSVKISFCEARRSRDSSNAETPATAPLTNAELQESIFENGDVSLTRLHCHGFDCFTYRATIQALKP